MSHMAMSSTPRNFSRSSPTSTWAISPRVPPVGTKLSPFSRKNLAPAAAAAPQPPSLVQLPPSPRMIFSQPCSTAWTNSWPTP